MTNIWAWQPRRLLEWHREKQGSIERCAQERHRVPRPETVPDSDWRCRRNYYGHDQERAGWCIMHDRCCCGCRAPGGAFRTGKSKLVAKRCDDKPCFGILYGAKAAVCLEGLGLSPLIPSSAPIWDEYPLDTSPSSPSLAENSRRSNPRTEATRRTEPPTFKQEDGLSLHFSPPCMWLGARGE